MMRLRSIFFIFLFAIVLSLAILLAIDWTRPMVFSTAIGLGEAFMAGIASIGASVWWQLYGIYITAIGMFSTGMILTALYYKGKIKMWQWGAQKAVETAYGTRQPAPAPTPTPLATAPAPTVAPTPIVQPEKKPEATA